MIIALTGTNAAGKGEVANILKEKGYNYYSLSDEIRAVATERGMELTRENLINTGNEFRAKEGAGVWAKRVLKKIKGTNIIVDSVRHPDEVRELRKKRAVLIAVDADVKLRFERALKRGRVGAETRLEDFIRIEKEESTNDKNKQQLLNTIKMADYTVLNNGSLEELKQKIEEILTELE